MADKEQISKAPTKKASSSTSKGTPSQSNVVNKGVVVADGKSASSSKQVSPNESGAVTKEVLLILQEMNTNLNVHNARLEKQEQRLDSLTEFMTNPPEYDYGHEYTEYGGCEDDEAYEADDCQNTAACSSGESKTKSTVFKSLVDKYQQIESVDNEINDDLAHFVNTSFKNGLSDDKQADIVKDIHRPQNCDALVKTRVNQGIWRLLKMNTQADDNRMQSIQNLIVKATANIVKLTDKNAESLDSEDMNWSTNAIALLGQANKMINVRRKEMHKADLDPKYHYLASASLPFTDLLYGDDNDVNRNVKEINDLNKIGRSLGRGYGRGAYRGFSNLRRPHPYRRGSFRGRGGRGRTDPQLAAKNARGVPRK